MKRFLIGALPLALALHASAQTPPTGAPVGQRTLEQEFTDLLQERHDRALAHDSEFIARMTGDTLVMVSERGTVHRLSRAQVVAALPAFRAEVPPEAKLTETVEEVAVRRFGDIAVVHYRLDSRMVINDEPVRKDFRFTEVFRRESGEWQSVALHETVIPGLIVPAAVDPAVYDDYVGQYQLFGHHVYTITREGDTLLFESRSGRRTELMPETASTFVLRGELYRVLFMRSAEGVVTHLRMREFPGVEYNAVRVR